MVMQDAACGYVATEVEVCNFGILSASILLVAVRWESDIIFTKNTTVAIYIIIPDVPPWVSVPYVAVVASIVWLSWCPRRKVKWLSGRAFAVPDTNVVKALVAMLSAS